MFENYTSSDFSSIFINVYTKQPIKMIFCCFEKNYTQTHKWKFRKEKKSIEINFTRINIQKENAWKLYLKSRAFVL